MKKVEGNGRSSQKGSQGGAHWELKARVKFEFQVSWQLWGKRVVLEREVIPSDLCFKTVLAAVWRIEC